MRRIRISMALAACVAATMISARAHALKIKYDPFGNGSSIAYIGADPNNGYNNWIVWFDAANSSNCLWQYLGDGPSFSDSVEVFGSGGDDLIRVLSWTQGSLCGGFTLTTPNT